MKIGFASGSWSQTVTDENGHPVWGGSGWVRLGQYANMLDSPVVVGILATRDGVFGVKDWDGEFHFDCDVVVMQTIMFADLPHKMEIARANGQVLINDLDDWYWGLSPQNQAFWATHPRLHPDENATHYRSILARSSGVMVSTPYLADRVKDWVKCPMAVIRNTVDMSQFNPRPVVEVETPVVGWVGSTIHRSGDVGTLSGVLAPMFRNGEVALHHSGHSENHPTFASQLGVPDEAVTTLPLVAPANYHKVFTFDIGVVPLVDAPFNRAKSWIKGLEYAAAGIPFVAAMTDEYLTLAREGIGIAAKRPQDWKRGLRMLLDAGYRQESAERALDALPAHDILIGARVLNDYLHSWS